LIVARTIGSEFMPPLNEGDLLFMPIAERNDLTPIRLYEKVADRLIFDARAPREGGSTSGIHSHFFCFS